MRPLRILVVIVNYRSATLSIESLRSLAAEVEGLPGLRAVVVENDSGDDSLEVLQQAVQSEGWGSWAEILPSDRNGGYAYGNNFAIRPALASTEPPDYVHLLNPDTLVRPGAVQALVKFLEERPDVGIAGSSFENADGSLWPIAFRFPSLLSELDRGLQLGVVTKLLQNWVVPRTMEQKEAQVDWMPGASMMIRRAVFEKIGLMDDDYFLYFEETDFFLQARRAGWTAWYVPKSRVMHIRGQSTGVTQLSEQPKRLPDYWFESRQRYFVKNYGLFYTGLTDIVWMVAYALWRVRRVIQRKPDKDPPFMLADFFRNSVLQKRVVKRAEKGI
ncbi:MAG: glycosyltransferase family 2 protein [Cyanobacteria bacterium J06641_5]